MEERARAITIALEDPLAPNVCSVCLFLFVARVANEDEWDAERRILRLHHHGLWHAILVFILATSTTDVQPAVAHRLLTSTRSCRAPYADAETRQRHRRLVGTYTSERNILHTVIEFLCGLLTQGFVGSYKIVTKQRFNRHGLWPQSAKDLLPTGPEHWLQGMTHWMRTVHSSSVIRVFQATFLICRPELQPLLIVADHGTTLADAICVQLDSAADDSQTGRSTGHLSSNPRVRITLAASLLHDLTVRSGPGLSFQFRSVARRIFDSAQGALDYATPDTAQDNLASVCSSMLTFLGAKLSDSFVHPTVREREAHRRDTADAYQPLYGLLEHTARRRTCSWTGCGRHERELGESKLRICSRCRISKYCGTPCQKAHWKASHSDVCQTLSSLFAQIGLDFTPGLSAEQFTAACRSTAVDVQEVAKAYGVLEEENATLDGIGGPSADLYEAAFHLMNKPAPPVQSEAFTSAPTTGVQTSAAEHSSPQDYQVSVSQ